MLVSPQNPLKQDSGMLPQEHRLEMVKIVADGSCGVRASDFEFHLPLPSFTYRTLCALRDRWPQHRFRLMTGSDNWLIFDRWRDADKIIEEFGLLIYPRPGYPLDPDSLPANAAYMADAPQIELSSTFIRQGLAASLDMNYFLPSAVYRYIQDNNLYTNGN